MAQDRVTSRVAEIRKGRGIGTADLAKRIGVTRQMIHAIETGSYVPNTGVALQLARELEVEVGELFALSGAAQQQPGTLPVEVLGGEIAMGQPMRICQIGERWVGVPVSATPYYMPAADGVVSRAGQANRAGAVNRADLTLFGADDDARRRVVLAGCDPATSLLSQMVERMSGVEVVPAPATSRQALEWLREDKVHIAGMHLKDPKSGEFNLPFVHEEFSGEDMMVVTFAQWEEGFVVARGNPKGIWKVEDLTRKGVRFVNREAGSGSRALLDKMIEKAGLEPKKVRDYDRIAMGHLAAAYRVASGDADVCIATRSAALAFGLDLVPVQQARYDLVKRGNGRALECRGVSGRAATRIAAAQVGGAGRVRYVADGVSGDVSVAGDQGTRR